MWVTVKWLMSRETDQLGFLCSGGDGSEGSRCLHAEYRATSESTLYLICVIYVMCVVNSEVMIELSFVWALHVPFLC